MIVSGVLMFVFGNYEIAGTELAGQYDLFVSYCDKGDTVNAERLGTDLLNNSKYRSVMTDKTTAEILRYMGDCYLMRAILPMPLKIISRHMKSLTMTMSKFA